MNGMVWLSTVRSSSHAARCKVSEERTPHATVCMEYTGIYLSKDTERGPPGAGNLAGWAGRVQYLPYS